MNRNLIVRALTGAVFVALLLTSLFLGGYLFLAFFSLVVFFGVYEMTTLVSDKKSKGFSCFCAVIAMSIFLMLSVEKILNYSLSYNYEYIAFSALFLIPAAGLFWGGVSSLKMIAAGMLGTLILAGVFSGMATIFCLPQGTTLLIAFFCIIWTYDTFAYLVGSAIGKHRMYESISPKKSWEGAIGGLVFAIVCASVFSYFNDLLTLWQWIIYAMIIIVFGTIGDFCESLLKRSVNAKDSGKILPGHGGVLDRFDSTIFAIPFILLYLQIINQLL